MAGFQRLDDDVVRLMGPAYAEQVGRPLRLPPPRTAPPPRPLAGAPLTPRRSRPLQQLPQGKVNALDFHRTHDLLVTSSEDSVIRIYNTASGQPQQSCESKKYGAACVRWTHAPTGVVYASSKVSRARRAPSPSARGHHLGGRQAPGATRHAPTRPTRPPPAARPRSCSRARATRTATRCATWTCTT
jgi:hypothetical protein